MYMREAVELVLGAIADTAGRELFIPILPAYRLGDLAEAMRANYDEPLGLPEWEKQHESMGSGNSSEHALRLTVNELRDIIWLTKTAEKTNEPL